MGSALSTRLQERSQSALRAEQRQTNMITFNRDTNRAVTRKKSLPEVKCRIEESTLDNKVSRKLSEIKETLSSSSSSGALGLKLKQFNILNENRQIDPVDISINLCDLEL